MSKHQPSEYKAIAAWGQILGSSRWYIEQEQIKAAATDAPLDAIYERDGVWATARDITNPKYDEFKAQFALKVGPFTTPDPIPQP